ncbi:membrane protein [Streptomyces cinnamoneus]|uniref:Membrane protein n=2 Tax=Streptomyces cinnamoneus TaxID=53446 RepID=A0A918TMD4_STRCJ|nr:membrane protein [Streptomyces cinnamoneus]
MSALSFVHSQGLTLPAQDAPGPVRAKLVHMQPYEERLTAPRSWWFIAVLTGVAMALILLPLGTLPMLGGLVGGGALAAAAVSSYGSVRIRVVGDSLVAGDAKIPVGALGAPEVLDAEEARAWRTHKADTRAFMLLRGYVPTAVRIEVTDPADPTPYLYLSTRSPERLAAALTAVRA